MNFPIKNADTNELFKAFFTREMEFYEMRRLPNIKLLNGKYQNFFLVDFLLLSIFFEFLFLIPNFRVIILFLKKEFKLGVILIIKI